MEQGGHQLSARQVRLDARDGGVDEVALPRLRLLDVPLRVVHL